MVFLGFSWFSFLGLCLVGPVALVGPWVGLARGSGGSVGQEMDGRASKVLVAALVQGFLVGSWLWRALAPAPRRRWRRLEA